MRFFWFIVLLVGFGVFFSVASSTFFTDREFEDGVEHYAYLSGAPIRITVAATPKSRSVGLSGQKSIRENHGLLFAFDHPDTHGIWMKNMQFPIDIFWLNQQLRIIHIEERVSPSSYPEIFKPDSPALYVLETQAGYRDQYSLEEGDQLRIIFDRPDAPSFDLSGIFK